MTKEKKLNAEVAVATQRPPGDISFRDIRDVSTSSALSLLKVTLVAALAIGMAGCGTKTELLKPDGKPSPSNQRDPSQPPSPISR